MAKKLAHACGSWKSPLSASLLAKSAVRLNEPDLDETWMYWHETRPAESGRGVIVRRHLEHGQTEDLIPSPYSVRSRVHEYGGGAYKVSGGQIFFVNNDDQDIYVSSPGESPRRITNAPESRFADLQVDEARGRIICIEELHGAETVEPVNRLVSVSLHPPFTIDVLEEGEDFYASPSLDADCRRIAWLSWSHPFMPWQQTRLHVAEFGGEGQLKNKVTICDGNESAFQPQWSARGDLIFVSDRNGWWNLYRWSGGNTSILWDKQAEFGLPQWVFAMSTWDFVGPDEIFCTYCESGLWHLARLAIATGEASPVPTNYTAISSVRANAKHAVFLAAGPDVPESVVCLDLDAGDVRFAKHAQDIAILPCDISRPEAITWPALDQGVAYGFFYEPANCEYIPLESERPPLIVMSHGGPTAATNAAYNSKVQFWTTRGFAVLDVNYRGSTGYGRGYREQLSGHWGIRDVSDCVAGAMFLANEERVDRQRMAIRGSSAGGYTTLCALTFYDVFSAGASLYGISDLHALLNDTHKFESRYLDDLIGPYPESEKLYHDRSPINFPQKLSCPVIFMQGAEDRVVPPQQAETMVQALRARGVPVTYILFEGEQHGFRQSETIRRALDAELSFYGKIFGFTPAADNQSPGSR